MDLRDLAFMDRKKRREWFKEFHKKIGLTWEEFNNQIPKRKPVRKAVK